MSSDCNKIQDILLRGGTDQGDRNNTILDPDSIVLHGFGISEWMAFAYNFAEHVNYFEIDNSQIPNGNWQAFFKDDIETIELLKELDNSNELTPHLTLYICFLKLIEFSSEHINKITERHLDFYYEEFLQIDKLPAQNDKVHVLFELSRSILQNKFEIGTQLNGDKDSNGKLRSYVLPEEFVGNQAKIKEMKSYYFDPDFIDPQTGATQNNYYMKASEVPNSSDGLGDELPEENPSWYAFGYNHNRTDSTFSELADAKVGFAISSNVLNLSEGTRHAEFEIQFSQSINSFSFNQLFNSIDVYYTAEKNWIGPLGLEENSTVPSPMQATTTLYSTSVDASANKVKFYVKLDSGKDAVTNYDQAIHEQRFDTSNPVFRFVIKPNSIDGLEVYKTLRKTISSIKIKVEAQDMKNLVIDNDQGKLNSKKPSYPFTTIPKIGSNFSLYHSEIFGKKWGQIKVNLKWLNVPDDLNAWYAAYLGPYRVTMTKGVLDLKQTITRSGSNINYSPIPFSITNRIITGVDDIRATKYVKNNNNWESVGVSNLFTYFPPSNAYATSFTYLGGNYTNSQTSGVRISLNDSFLHDMFARLYAVSLTVDDEDVLIPNEPYTPFAEEVSVTYTAQDSITFNTDETKFETRAIQLFHEHPFGQSEEHSYLKSVLTFVQSNACTLAPVYCRGGELYLSLENADHLQTVSLLVQVSEGTENTAFSSFLGGQKVTWEILCSNEWKTLDSTLLSQNEIDNFLQSGIVAFKIPKEATQSNSLLAPGTFWIRAKMHKTYDAVCKVLGIHAQATLAEFQNNDNDLSHLIKGLPAETISKMINRSSKVKSIAQPYNSFDGKPEESQELYYKRVSERLRHKHRSITLWDYENIVLQEYPDIFNIKCLNHTSDDSFTAAGHVTLVVIPDTVDKNVFDIYEPRVSTAYLNRIKNYVDQWNSLHVKMHVINPDYEALRVDLKVKFREGYDEALYKIELNTDITKLLSPWAFDSLVRVDFGGTLHRSRLIEYIENLPYVDYVQDVLMLTSQGTSIQKYTPSSPKAIMVSAKQHTISTEIVTCVTPTNTITEECQQ